MKRNVNYLLIVCLSLLFINCSNDESAFYFDEESRSLVSEGIAFKGKGGNVSLTFQHEKNAEVSIDLGSADKWLKVNYEMISDAQSTIKIKASENDSQEERTGNVILQVNDDKVAIAVTQVPLQQIHIGERYVIASCNKGEVSVSCQTTGDINVSLSMQPDWVDVSEIRQTETGHEIILSVDENTGLGRIAKVFVEGTDGGLESFAIQQKPHPFDEKVEVETGGAGRLPVLLGDDTENLRNIRSLTVRGAINGWDVLTLKKMFVAATGLTDPLKYPLELDLSEAHLKGNYDHVLETEYHIEVALPDDIVSFEDNALQEKMFSYAQNLVSVKMPLTTRIIGRHAFEACTALSSIEIPTDVEQIRYGAFQQCPNLTRIDMDRWGGLSVLQGYAFNTRSVIESLSIPEGLEEIAESAFSGCSCKEMYVYWLTPPEIRVLPNPKSCILYVPQGSRDTYLASPNWSRFKEIKEVEE